MFSRLALLASFLALAAAEYGCSSFAQLTHTSSGCPANQGNPDCSFIQANAAQFCSTTATSWEIINGPNCNLRGASYGCIYAAGLYSTTDQFCCPLIVTGGAPVLTATATTTGSASASASPSVTVTSSGSASASPSVSATSSGSASPSVSATVSLSPSLSSNASLSSSQTGTATQTGLATATTLINTTTTTNINMTNQTAISADKSLSENDKIGIGVGIGLNIVMLIGCYYFFCIFRFRSKETENIERLPSQIQRRQPRGGDHLEIRTPRARGESKV